MVGVQVAFMRAWYREIVTVTIDDAITVAYPWLGGVPDIAGQAVEGIRGVFTLTDQLPDPTLAQSSL
jgi:hypothetical protein